MEASWARQPIVPPCSAQMDPLRTEPLTLADLTDLPGVGVVLFDRELRLETVLGGAVEMHGYAEHLMVGRRAPDVIPAPAWARIGPLCLRALAGESFEEEVTAHDGRQTYLIAFGPVRRDGEIVGGQAIAREVTALRRVERDFRQLAESATDIITITRTSDGKLLYCSPSARRLGYEPADVVGTHGFSEVHADDVEAVAAARAGVVAGGPPVTVSMRLRDTAGAWQWVESDIRAVADEVHCSSRIVTERRRLEAGWELTWQHTKRGCSLSDPETGAIVDVNPAFVAMHGGTREDYLGRPLASVLSPAGVEGEHVRADGSVFPVEAEEVVTPAFRIGYFTDLTQARARERQDAETRATFERAFADAPIGMALVGLDGSFLRANRALLEMLGYDEPELCGTPFADITHPNDLDADLAQLEKLVAGEIDHYSMEKRYFTAAGDQLWALLSVSLVSGADGAPRYFVSQIMDISARKRTEERLRYFADRDPLTGLWNRRRFEEDVRRQTARAQRYGESAALLAFDLDGFKYVNDTLGHGAGDDLLIHVGHTISRRLRDTDALARLGGDEFAALLPNVSLREAVAIGQELCELLAASPLMIEGEAVQLSMSAGAMVIDEAMTGDAMIAADVALFEAKHQGRGRAVAFEDAGDQERRLTNGLSWSRRLRRALAEDGFELFAQPIVDLETGRPAMHELLLRMPDGEGGFIAPGDFLYTAERFGLIRPLDRWVIAAAARLAATHPDSVLSVNLSGRSVTDPSLCAYVEDAIAAAGCAPAQLIFEVTETEAIAAMEPARALATRLRSLGCRFALDDFGSGFASFSHLKALPLDLLKIDGEFVRNLESDHTDQLVVDAVQRVAGGMGKALVAEHVEDAATAERLRRLGVRYGQGYHFARPAPAEAVLAHG